MVWISEKGDSRDALTQDDGIVADFAQYFGKYPDKPPNELRTY